MLTVKHIRFDGAETVDVAERVIFYPSDKADMSGTPTPYAGGSVSLVGARAAIGDYHHGVVYVMNDKGATISKYDLGNCRREMLSGEAQ
jgi:hypothetical protein